MQKRLENIWNCLLMPEKDRLDMAIKYSSDKWHTLMSEAVEKWIEVTNLVIKREHLIYQLENFERIASNPMRLFEKKNKASDRLEEEKTRHIFHKKIENLELKIKPVMKDLKVNFE